MLRSFFRPHLLPCAFLALGVSRLFAEPSGGPYGPIPTTYGVPEKAAHVYYVAPDGRPEALGKTVGEPTTLEAALPRVVTGDAIILRGGTYRTGNLRLNQGITLQPYANEQPIIKGTQVASQWFSLRNGLWRTSWKSLFPAKPLGWWSRDYEGKRTPLHRFNNDMVFVDGVLLKSAGWLGEVTAGTYYVDYASGQIYIGTDPTNHLVEITAYDNALIRTSGTCHDKVSDKKGPIIRGITFTQYAYRALDIEAKKPAVSASEEPTDDPVGPSEPATYGKEVVGTTLENVTISFCSRVSGYFRGDHVTIRNCLISDTRTEGIYLIGASDSLLERNIIRRNNMDEITGYYASSVKIFNQSHHVVVRDNLVLDNPHSNGIWFDVGNQDGVIVNNWVEGAQVGFFFEISKGAICAGNAFVRCGIGSWALNSCNVRVYQNTYVDCGARFERNERSAKMDLFGWHPRTGPDVDQREGHALVGNLLVATEAFHGPLASFDQAKGLTGKLTKPMAHPVDGNVYVREGDHAKDTLVIWSPAAGDKVRAELGSLDALRSLQPGVEAQGRLLDGIYGSIFQSLDLRRLDLVQPLQGLAPAAKLPEDVRTALGWPDRAPTTPGAYPLASRRSK